MLRIRTLFVFALLILFVVSAPAEARRLAPGGESHVHIEPLPKNSAFFIAIGRCEQPAPAGRQLEPPSQSFPYGVWADGYEYGINWHHPGPTYPGGLGVFAPLWTEDGLDGRDLAPSAVQATPIEQMLHAQRIVDKYGPYAWGCAGVALSQAKIVLG